MQRLLTADRWWNSDVLEAAGIADDDDDDDADSVIVETLAPWCEWHPYQTAVDLNRGMPSAVDDPGSVADVLAGIQSAGGGDVVEIFARSWIQ